MTSTKKKRQDVLNSLKQEANYTEAEWLWGEWQEETSDLMMMDEDGSINYCLPSETEAAEMLLAPEALQGICLIFHPINRLKCPF